eukprot:m.115528 g.115528  ORF g.115528 m.115528 type:complete len:411 (+) comp13574_c0_seq1:327-1559(+)
MPSQVIPSSMVITPPESVTSETAFGADVVSVEAPKSRKCSWKKAMMWTAAALFGVVSGFGLQKSHVVDPAFVRRQFLFESFLMFKVFLAALATSCLCLMLIAIFFKDTFNVVRVDFHDGIQRGVFSSAVLGGILVGVGMALSASCPSLIGPQLGANIPNMWAQLVGMLLGSLVYCLFEYPMVRFEQLGPKFSAAYLDELINKRSWPLQLGLFVVVTAVVVALEMVFPWRDDLPVAASQGTNALRDYAWPPFVGGILVGCIQIPAAFFVETTLGCRQGVCVISAIPALALPKKVTTGDKSLYQRFASYPREHINWYQFLFLLSLTFGSFLSAFLSDSIGEAAPLPIVDGLLGGAIILIGAHLAQGCTQGHGITGLSLLCLYSFVIIPCVFGGGAALAFTYQAIDGGFVPTL